MCMNVSVDVIETRDKTLGWDGLIILIFNISFFLFLRRMCNMLMSLVFHLQILVILNNATGPSFL